jgi:hypothetical protein
MKLTRAPLVPHDDLVKSAKLKMLNEELAKKSTWTFDDLGKWARITVPRLEQDMFKKHDCWHILTGALFTHEGEVLINAFYNWPKKGNASFRQGKKLFKEAEEKERGYLFTTRGETLASLTGDEIKAYTKYFNRLINEFLRQSGKDELPEDLSNFPLLQTPKDWLAYMYPFSERLKLGWLMRMFKVS